MTKTLLKYIGKYQAYGEIIEARGCAKCSLVEALLKTGDYELLSDEYPEEKEVVSEVPNLDWTEKEIKNWIKFNEIDVKYDIKNDTKKDIMLRLKDAGAI